MEVTVLMRVNCEVPFIDKLKTHINFSSQIWQDTIVKYLIPSVMLIQTVEIMMVGHHCTGKYDIVKHKISIESKYFSFIFQG